LRVVDMTRVAGWRVRPMCGPSALHAAALQMVEDEDALAPSLFDDASASG